MNRDNLLRNIVIALIVICLIFIISALYLNSSKTSPATPAADYSEPANIVPNGNTNQPTTETAGQTQNSGTNAIQIPKGKLVILKATYGSPQKSVDVTKQLNGLVTNNSLSVAVSNSIAGDPDYGTIKTLEIQYSVNGAQFKKTYQENEKVSLP